VKGGAPSQTSRMHKKREKKVDTTGCSGKNSWSKSLHRNLARTTEFRRTVSKRNLVGQRKRENIKSLDA